MKAETRRLTQVKPYVCCVNSLISLFRANNIIGNVNRLSVRTSLRAEGVRVLQERFAAK